MAISELAQAVLKNDGRVVCYRDNVNWSGPIIIKELNDIVQIIFQWPGKFYALRRDGLVFYWDSSCKNTLDETICEYTKSIKVSGLNNIVSISGNDDIVLSLDKKGTVWATGDDWHGLMSNLPALKRGEHRIIKNPIKIQLPFPMLMISVGWYCSSGIDIYGNVLTWGYEHKFNCSRGIGREFKGKNGFNALKINNIPKAKFIATGINTFIITNTGDVWSWCLDNYLKFTEPSAPKKFIELNNIVNIWRRRDGVFFKDKYKNIKYIQYSPDDFNKVKCKCIIHSTGIMATDIDLFQICYPVVINKHGKVRIFFEDKVITLNLGD